MRELEATRDRRRTASKLEGGEEGEGWGRSVSERESRSERGRKEVDRTKARRRRPRPRVEAGGGEMGYGRESSVVRGGTGEKWRGPREAGSGATDGAANTAETGKRERQSSERFMEGKGGGTGARAGARLTAGADRVEIGDGHALELGLEEEAVGGKVFRGESVGAGAAAERAGGAGCLELG